VGGWAVAWGFGALGSYRLLYAAAATCSLLALALLPRGRPE
jgi:hypothetical protein